MTERAVGSQLEAMLAEALDARAAGKSRKSRPGSGGRGKGGRGRASRESSKRSVTNRCRLTLRPDLMMVMIVANRALLARAGRERPEAHRLRVRPDRLGQDVHDGGRVQRCDWSSAGLDGGAAAAAGAGLPGDDTLRDLRREVLREPNHRTCKAAQTVSNGVRLD